jgi:hypothetical protein
MYAILRTCEPKKPRQKFIVGSNRLRGECGRLRKDRFPSERHGVSEKTAQPVLQEGDTSAMYFADAKVPSDSRYTYLMTWHRQFSKPSRMVVIYRS